MSSRQTLGFAALTIFALAGCVLIDSWFMEEGYVDIDGEGPEAPIPIFEIAAKSRPIEVDLDTAPPIPICIETSTDPVHFRTTAESVLIAVRPRPVDPAGWLGRRHFRSPT